MCTLNDRLRQLALNAQEHPPQTRGRQLALDELIRTVMRSDEFYCPPSSGFSVNVYRELKQEALQELWFKITRAIDNYDPNKGEVIAWINTHFSWRFIDAVAAWRNQGTVDIDPETVMPTTETPSLTDQLRDLITEDPDGIFREKHITDHPEATFKTLVSRRIAGESWEHMAAEFGITSVRIRVFYHRSLRQFQSYLREGLQE